MNKHKKFSFDKPRRPPLYLRFLNGDIDSSGILTTFSFSPDKRTSEAAKALLENPTTLNLDSFKEEMKEAVDDLIKEGLGEEFKSFVNHYMGESLVEDVEIIKSRLGQNQAQTARIKDENSPWVQGFLCYNLSLYIKGFGLESLKRCKICSKLFEHKGKYAVYCSDLCKSKKA